MSDISPSDSTRPPATPPTGAVVSEPVTTADPSDFATGPLDPGVVAPSSRPRRVPAEAIQLPDFELLKEIGRGGMGVVYKARQKALDRTVAVKMLLGDPALNPTVLTRFLAEAKAAAALNHPNLVAVYHIGEVPGGHYFAMEYVKGPTLQKVLDRQGPELPLPIEWSVNLVIPVAEAVHYAHSRGIVHRDLKPANIMIETATGRPVVLDFGIARRLDEPAGLTRAGVIIGTPSYMPPEQAGEAVGAVGPPSDVYALGAILYRMITGRLPYEAETALATLLLVASPQMPPSPREICPDVPTALSAICMKCLNKRPADRFQTAAALADALREYPEIPEPAEDEPQAEAADPPSRRAASAGPPAVLIVESTGEEIALTKLTTVIGRGAGCDIVLKKSDVSKRHCRIILRSDQAEVEDLDSVNGTSINGQPVRRCRLRDGDLLEIADYPFRVKLQLPDAV